MQYSGDALQWHKLTLEFDGPFLEEAPSTFTDYRLDVTFTHESGEQITVPGYFAADGDAANTSATSGTQWNVHFNAPLQGNWTWEASFRTGDDIAISTDAGASAGFMDGTTGSFDIAPSDKTGDDLRSKGMLEYNGDQYLNFAGTDEVFLKSGVGGPENFLAYSGFDNTPDSHDYAPHIGDFNAGDPTWGNGEGAGIIGAINYLADQGVNSFYMMLMNIGGDGRDVSPWVDTSLYNLPKYPNNGAPDPDLGTRVEVFDVSKLAQWETVFEHMQEKGMSLHLFFQETENDQMLDGGGLGPERMLYMREMVARFGHHNGLIWNLGEENSNRTNQLNAFSDYLKGLDPYDHPVALHTFPDQHSKYEAFEGTDTLDVLSFQTDNATEVPDLDRYLGGAEDAGRPVVAFLDEPGNPTAGLAAEGDPGWQTNHANLREVLYKSYAEGASGAEWYFGYQTAGGTGGDLDLEDFRTRDSAYEWAESAREFYEQLPLEQMRDGDNLTSGSESHGLALDGEIYAYYLPNGGSINLNLSGQPGTYNIGWYDPINGGTFLEGSVSSVQGGGVVSIGSPPNDLSSEAAVVIWNTSVYNFAVVGSQDSIYELANASQTPLDSAVYNAETGILELDFNLGKTLDINSPVWGDVRHIDAIRIGNDVYEIIIHDDNGPRDSNGNYIFTEDTVETQFTLDIGAGRSPADGSLEIALTDNVNGTGTLYQISLDNTSAPAAPPDPSDPPSDIVTLLLVDTTTGETIGVIEPDGTLPAGTLGKPDLSVVAEVSQNVGSVRLTLDDQTRLENVAPYVLFGDENGGFIQPDSAPFPTTGAYNISVQVYSGANGSGGLIESVSYTTFVTQNGAPPVEPPADDPVNPPADDPVPPSSEATWVDVDGTVVIQAENGTFADPNDPGNSTWVERTSQSGFTGESYLHWDGPNLYGSRDAGSGTLSYEFEVSESGFYALSMLASRPNNGLANDLNNDFWVRIDGGEWIKFFFNHQPRDSWGWGTKFDINHNYPTAGFDLTAGVHTLEFSGRSEDAYLDKIHLSLGSLNTNRNLPETLAESVPADPVDPPAQNRAPNAVNDNVGSVNAGTETLLNTLLSNDTDPDGDTLSIISVTPLTTGFFDTLDITDGTGIRVVFNADATGEGTFEYTVSDGKGGTDTALVSVLAPPAPPADPVDPPSDPVDPPADPVDPPADPVDPSDIVTLLLVDTTTNQTIGVIEPGGTLPAGILGKPDVSIVADVNQNVGSVQLTLGNQSQLENVAPYVLFGDEGGNFKEPDNPPFANEGSYNISIQVYSGANGSGNLIEDISYTMFVTQDGAAPVDPPADPVDPPADPVDPPADPVDPPADPVDPPVVNEGAFIEENGLVVIEMESLISLPSNWKDSIDYSPTTSPGLNNPGKAAGDDFIIWQGSQYFNNPGNGLLEYEVQITTPGTYRFQWHSQVSKGTNTTEHNDTWLKIEADQFYGAKGGDPFDTSSYVHPKGAASDTYPNGADPAEGGGKSGWFKVYSSGTTNWTWSTQTSDNDAHQIYAQFDEPGTYSILVSARSSSHAIDRMVLSLVDGPTSSSEAQNLNLPESERVGEGNGSGPTPLADIINGDGGNNLLFGDLGNDTIDGLGGSDTINGGGDDDHVYGGSGRDLINLDQGNDLFTDAAQAGAAGSDTVFGGTGNDTFGGWGGNDELHGEAGDDLIYGGEGNDSLSGGADNDAIIAGEGDDTVDAGTGRDWVDLGEGEDQFFDNEESLIAGNDIVFAGDGNDSIYGWGGNDVFNGEGDDDLIYGGSGNDTIDGGSGADAIIAGSDNDSVIGGLGDDWVSLDEGADIFQDDFEWDGGGNDIVFGGAGNDSIFGWGGNDFFDGGADNDLIYGGFGRDVVIGGAGRDFIDLGSDDDRYVDTNETGTLGQDTITGGTGVDTFVFGDVVSQDVITDFETGIDRLELSAALVAGRNAQQVVDQLASVTSEGVLLTIGDGQSILLEGLTSTSGLANDIDIVSSQLF